MNTSLIAFVVGLIASLGLTVPVRQLALRTGMVDHPGPRKVHLQPMPLLGGLAIYGGVLIALLVSMDGPALTQVIGIYSGATLVALVGILDDRGLLHHQIKLFGAMPAAAVILLASGIRAQVFPPLLAGNCGSLGGHRADPGVGGRHYRLIQHSGPHGRIVRRNRGDGVAVLRHFRARERTTSGQHHGRRGPGSRRRIPALEFQARKNLHG